VVGFCSFVTLLIITILVNIFLPLAYFRIALKTATDSMDSEKSYVLFWDSTSISIENRSGAAQKSGST